MSEETTQVNLERVTTWLKREVTFTLPNWVLVLAAVLVLALVFD